MEMSSQNLNYQRIAKAIAYIQVNFKHQPTLDEIAAHVNLSPFHFQRIFLEWAGTTPKKFLQYISLTYAKKQLKNSRTIFETSIDTGLSSTSRLHDLFINIEAMTPGEYKNGGQNLVINHFNYETPFGLINIASTSKGICQISFIEHENESLDAIKDNFPNSTLIKNDKAIHREALKVFQSTKHSLPQINLHLKGTTFQLKVWEALLNIPAGNLKTYGDIARTIGNEDASRAVGTAIGNNPIAYLIPCHRVIQSTGIFGGYMWNPIRKTAIIGWEQAQINNNDDETF